MLEHLDAASRIAFARDHAKRLREDMSAAGQGRDVVTDKRPPRRLERGSGVDDARVSD
jgi:hypothetical protein